MATIRAHARPRTRAAFRIAIICALKVEADAVLQVLDLESTSWDRFGKAEGDNNTYTTGSINRHNVVVLYSGAGIPKTSAAAGHLFLSFPNISLVLVVGVCGGVPIAPDRRDIFLGDLVISSDAVHYTSKKQYHTGSARITRRDDELGKQQPEARNFVRKFELSQWQAKLQHDIQTELEKYHDINPTTFPLYPGTSRDGLFAPTVLHMHRDVGACEHGMCSTDGASVCSSARTATCSELRCGSEEGAYHRCRKPVTEAPAPSVHVGTFGTGDTVMKSGVDRDLIASKDSIDAFEMESAGVWDQRATIVIKSVCDYADSHKNDDWKCYAAGVAAVGLKALLQYKELQDLESSTEIPHVISLRDALTYPKRDAKLELIRGDHIPLNSFDWVWSKTPWKSWLCALGNEEAQFFWISGLPGSGKSTLMESLAVDKRTMKYFKKANQACKILRFFFDFRGGKDTANNRLGLLKMFVSELWHVYDANTPEGGKLEDRHARDPVDEMSEGKLLDLLSEMVDAIPQRLLVFVDGLDEYEGEHHGLVDFLQKLRRRTSMHLCLASRPEPAFESAFRDCPQFAMQNHNEASVRIYIDYAINAASPRLINSRILINSDIRELIVSKAQGVIIWARLAVDELLREDRVDTTPNALQKVIETLPRKLESMYEQVISRLPSEIAAEVALILLIIVELGKNGRINDELLYGYFTFLSERYPEVSHDPQIISDQFRAKGLHLYRMKARLRIRCGALVNISLQEPGIYAGGSWSQTDDGDLVTLKRTFWHPLSREPLCNPPWNATLCHRTFHAYVHNSQAILQSQLPEPLLRQYPDAFQSRVHANVIAAATEDGNWDLKANFTTVSEAIKEARSAGWSRHTSFKILFDDAFSTNPSSWRYFYAIILDSMRRMPIAARAQETCISGPYEAWKGALASAIHFITVAADILNGSLVPSADNSLDMFLVQSSENRVLSMAVRWCLPRLFCEAYGEVTTSHAMTMPTHQWHNLFSLTWYECLRRHDDMLAQSGFPDGAEDQVFYKRRLRSYDKIIRRIIPHLVTFDHADLPNAMITVDNEGEWKTEDFLLRLDMIYRVLFQTRKLPRFNPLLLQIDHYELAMDICSCLTFWIGHRNVKGEEGGLSRSRAERSDDRVEALGQECSPYTLCPSPADRLQLGISFLILRLLSNPGNVALLSQTAFNGWDAFQAALSATTCPPLRRYDEQFRNQRARAALVLLLVLARLDVDPGNWYDYRKYKKAHALLNNGMTEVQWKVSHIMLFALKIRAQFGHWPDYETILAQQDWWKVEVHRAFSDPLVRAMDDHGGVALETIEKYHRSLIDDGIIESE